MAQNTLNRSNLEQLALKGLKELLTYLLTYFHPAGLGLNLDKTVIYFTDALHSTVLLCSPSFMSISFRTVILISS